MAHSHDHDHEHDHDHSGLFHTHAPADKMKLSFFLAMIILAAELTFGLLSNSLALLADAWHMATDVLSIGLAWFALVQAKKPANKNMTFGYERAGILAAAINGLTLIVITAWILYSAIHRMITPEHVGSWGMFVGAGIGLVVNLIIVFSLSGEGHNLNVRATLLHVIGDVGASAGVIVAGIIIAFTGWDIVDPLISLGIAAIIAFSAWNICKKSFSILMESTPDGVELDKIAETIRSIEGVKDVHDLHAWTITSGKNALSCHAVLDGQTAVTESQTILREIEKQLTKLNIGHTTIQVEDPDHPHDDSLICELEQGGDHDHDHAHAH